MSRVRVFAVVAVVALLAAWAWSLRSSTTVRPVGHFGACAFDFPVGPPDAQGYYDAQPFGTNEHLGNDWNGNGGGDSDLGDPVHAIADGTVVLADDLGGGWGRVIRIEHACGLQRVEAIYAHLDTMTTAARTRVRRGDPIGTIGNAGGQYPAHLHFELRATLRRPIGAGYGEPVADQLDATAFIDAHRR